MSNEILKSFSPVMNYFLRWWQERYALIFSVNPHGNCLVDLHEKDGMHYVNFNIWMRCANKSTTNRLLSSLEKITWEGEKKTKEYEPPLKYQRSCQLWVEDAKTKEHGSNHFIPANKFRNVMILINYEIPSKEFKKTAKHFGDFLSVNLTIKDSSGVFSHICAQVKVHKYTNN